MDHSPILKRLSVEPDQSILFMNAAVDLPGYFGPLPEGVYVEENVPSGPVDSVFFFARSLEELTEYFPRLKAFQKSTGTGWVLVDQHALQNGQMDIPSIRRYAREIGYDVDKRLELDGDWLALGVKLIPLMA